MLVLSRKLGESIWIGDNVKVTIVQVRGGSVKIGISAPKDIPVNRAEVLELDREPTTGGADATPH